MLNRKVRPDLEELRSRLARWAIEVPARAMRFHDVRSGLEQQVAALLQRWLLRPGGAELESLAGQVKRLDELASPLALLIRQAEDVEKEGLDLRSTAERSADRELAAWLVDRCVDWQSTLRRLGTNVERRIELEQDQPILERTRERVRHHAEAVRLLNEARQLLDRLGDTMQTALLQADLPRLRQRLFEEGAGVAWLAAMDRAVGPVRALADLPPPEPPKTLQQVEPLLSAARRWSRVLGVGEEKVFEIQDELKMALAQWGEWTEERIAGLLRKVTDLLESLRRTAAERRGEALGLLGQRRRQLAAACGPNPELERELADLEAAPAGEPESHEDWMRRQAEVHRHLLNEASAHLLDLQERIVRWRRELEEGLDALGGELLSAQSRSKAERLRLDLQNLPDPYGQSVEGIFQSLETCDRVQLTLDGLTDKARTDREALAATERDLLARLEQLQELLQRALRPEVRVDAADLARWLEERSWESSPEPEERMRRLLDARARCDALLARLYQGEREARARADALRQWLKRFNEADLDRYCPEDLVRRASALIAALPSEPPSWAALADHLAAAEELSGRLETHARRVLAARLDRAIAGLERQIVATRDPAYARRITALLDELAACDERQSVPANLAAQILLLAPDSPAEATR